MQRSGVGHSHLTETETLKPESKKSRGRRQNRPNNKTAGKTAERFIMSTYKSRKESARQNAIEWQIEASERAMSYGELYEAGAYFEKLARRYGLTEEFRENGII